MIDICISYDDRHKDVLIDCRLRNISEITIKGYDFAYTYFKKYAGEDLMVSDITQDLINDNVLYTKGWLKAETVNLYQFKVSPIIKYGMSKDYIKNTTEFTRLSEQEHIKDIYTNDEFRRLLKRPGNLAFAVYRNRVSVNFLLATCIRAKEFTKDLDLEKGYIQLAHTKTGNHS